jgi:hypothetical protein
LPRILNPKKEKKKRQIGNYSALIYTKMEPFLKLFKLKKKKKKKKIKKINKKKKRKEKEKRRRRGRRKRVKFLQNLSRVRKRTCMGNKIQLM